MTKADQSNKKVDSSKETEEILIEKARGALSNCNWVIGECACLWTEKYAKGRTDTDFGNQIGLSSDQIFQRRRVWETFNDVRDHYPDLKWSHFYVSLNWEDSSECLSWAVENKATVAQMRAWRRSVHGEDLTEQGDPLALQALDFNQEMVKDAQGFMSSADNSEIPFEPTGSGELVGASGAESAPYSPYRKEARGDGSDSSKENSASSAAVAAPPALSPTRIVKRALGGILRIHQQLEELTDDDYNELTPEVINQLWDAYEELGRSIKRQA